MCVKFGVLMDLGPVWHSHGLGAGWTAGQAKEGLEKEDGGQKGACESEGAGWTGVLFINLHSQTLIEGRWEGVRESGEKRNAEIDKPVAVDSYFMPLI